MRVACISVQKEKMCYCWVSLTLQKQWKKMLPNKLNDLHVTERDASASSLKPLHVAPWIEETHWKWLPLHGHHQMAPAIGAKHDQRNLVFLGRRDSSSQNDGPPGADHPMMSRKGLRGWLRKTKGRSV
jgi:hypothetical protein